MCIALLAIAIALVGAGRSALAQDSAQQKILQRLEELEREQERMRALLREKDAKLEELEQKLERFERAQQPVAVPVPTEIPAAADIAPASSDGVPAVTPHVAAPAERKPERQQFGRYLPGRGFTIADTEYGEVNFGAYTYLRYLNQKGLDREYTNGLGQVVPIDRRNDVELNKVKLEFRGWFLDPRMRYVLYTWTNNTAQGQGAQVVVGGNLSWVFGEFLRLGGGIYPLPSVRSNEGAWPYFLGVDHRTMSDEFFRGSYTMGIFANGEPLPGLRYSSMLGNNLSILGVDADQLDGDFATIATALWWMPTTGEYGPREGFGDWEDHQEVATRIGGHFTFSPEDRQEQPGNDAPDNSQIRLSNATNIFTRGALAPDVQVNDLKFYMTSFDAGMKYRGVEIAGEYYLRWLDDFRADGPLPIGSTFDQGFQVLTSMMVWPRRVQVYTTGAYLFGEFGDPWEVTSGINWWMFARREMRLNLEYLYTHRSAVGYAAIPQALGGTGSIVNANVEVSY